MKGILRGLYNSIFRRLPLRFLLILLVVFSVLFACTRADYNWYSFIQTWINANSYGFTFARNGWRNVKILTNTQTTWYVCFNYNYYSINSTPSFYLFSCNTNYSNSYNLANQSDCTNLWAIIKITDNNSWSSDYYCYSVSWNPYLFISRWTSTSSTINFYYKYYYYIPSWITLDNIQSFTAVERDCPSCPSCPDTPTCDYSWYILESDITQQYCVSNNLCPSSDCPIYTWDSQWSALFINDIQHQGAWIIDITIPEEISWDYSNENDTFSLDVEWYNVDPDYINAIIWTQTYTPDSKDFSKVVSEIIPLFVPWLVVILFLYFVFRFIKKIF